MKISCIFCAGVKIRICVADTSHMIAEKRLTNCNCHVPLDVIVEALLATRFRLSWIVLRATPRRRPISRALTPSW